MSDKIEKIGCLGRALKDQPNGYGFDVVKGQLAVISEDYGYSGKYWERVVINQAGEVFAASKHLTFEKIKDEQ